MTIEEKFLGGDKRAAARMITLVESKDQEALNILKRHFSKVGHAYVIGITGPPGAGKSTLTDRLAKLLRKKGKTVGIIAVDPTSPFTGGAILGDRIRMNDLATDPGVFIRSMGTRGHLGGLSEATDSAMKVLDIFGMDYLLIETVGVGQSEVEIVKKADTTVMVMVPGLGDDIQAIKAGIMEIGDLFVVNKADRDGADRTAAEIESTLESSNDDWRPPVMKVVAVHNEGIDLLLDKIELHREYLENTGKLRQRRIENAKNEIIEIVQNKIIEKVMFGKFGGHDLEGLAVSITDKKTDPYSVSEQILSALSMDSKENER